MIDRNSIIQGDCLEWLDRVKPNSADLCYLDPPFFTKRNFKDFTDMWWGGMNTYLYWMRKRIQKIHRVLKPDGFFVLQCDHNADYKLRVILEDIFGEKNFRGHVIWKRRANAFLLTQDKEFQKDVSMIHDSLFFFSKSDSKKLNKQYISQEGAKEIDYKKVDPINGKRYLLKLLGRMSDYTDPTNNYTFMGVSPKDGHGWMLSEKTMTERYSKGLIVLNKDKNQIYLKMYKPERGHGVGSVWIDIAPNNSGAHIYSTQKPERLLKRIIKMCTQEGDLVLDCFGGSGTTAAVAKKLGRDYIIGDVNPESIKIMTERLKGIQNDSN